MALPKERVFHLLDAYISKRSTTDEENELMAWILEAGEDAELKNFAWDIWNQQNHTKYLSDGDWNMVYACIMKVSEDPLPSVKIRRSGRFGLAVAAAVVLIVLFTGYYFNFFARKQPTVAAISPSPKDIAPPSESKAMLTLADGTSIEVDGTTNGTIAMQGSVRIIKKSNGEIAYAGNTTQSVGYNTFSVPRGSKPLSLILSDGTLVWLNVGSSLTYPTAFTNKERRVTISGEAYFEVAHNAAMPFRVQHDDITVSVLGTHFNVNTYEDEVAERVTLLEGSVQVSKNGASQLLRPGQQASISHDETNNINVLNEVNLDEVIAWKNGRFSYNNTDLKTIMRQIMRWYNVDVEYKDSISVRYFTADISRDRNLSAILKALELSSIHFRLEENSSSGYAGKIIILP